MPTYSQVDLSAYIRTTTEISANKLMDVEASGLVRAAHYERSGTRTAYRNGYRTRYWKTEAGRIVLHIPKLRSGSYYPTFLEYADDARAYFAALATEALAKPITAEAVQPLLSADNAMIASKVALVINEQAQIFLSRKFRHPYPHLKVVMDEGQVVIYGERDTGTWHLLTVCESGVGRGY